MENNYDNCVPEEVLDIVLGAEGIRDYYFRGFLLRINSNLGELIKIEDHFLFFLFKFFYFFLLLCQKQKN